MICPIPDCGGDACVIDSRPANGNRERRRRYECLRCRERFTTREVHDAVAVAPSKLASILIRAASLATDAENLKAAIARIADGDEP